jgi:hypothetical protein
MPKFGNQSLDIPQIQRGIQIDYTRLYYSNPEAALKVPITVQAGYGLIPQGCAMSKNLSAGGNAGLLLPYNPTTFTGAENHPGRAYLVADTHTTTPDFYVSQEDSYKFAVGDDLIINDDTTSGENVGAITAIDRSTDLSRAKITATTNIGGTAFTVARKANVFVEAGTSGNNYSDCVGLIEKAVHTGTGVRAAGAVATLILGNAVLYDGLLTNFDAAAKIDISATVFGQFVYMK